MTTNYGVQGRQAYNKARARFMGFLSDNFYHFATMNDLFEVEQKIHEYARTYFDDFKVIHWIERGLGRLDEDEIMMYTMEFQSDMVHEYLTMLRNAQEKIARQLTQA